MSSTTSGPLHLRLVRTTMPTPALRRGSMVDRAQFRLARRRRLTILSSAGLAILWATLETIGARERGYAGASAVRQGIDGALVIAWMSLLVAVPFATAVKPKPVRAGALAAVVTGPMLTPVVLGHGWGLLPILVLLASTALALAPAKPIAGRRR